MQRRTAKSPVSVLPAVSHQHSAQRDEAFLEDVLDGLRAEPKTLPCKLLYDERGSEIFERITELDAYYPARTEIALLERHLPEIAELVGPCARVIEPGSSDGVKTGLVLEALDQPSVYVPIDVSGEQLERTAKKLRNQHPGVEIRPLHADYTIPLTLPKAQKSHLRSLVFFPGSTIGNFEPAEARAFLARFATLAGPHAMMLLGADSTDDPKALTRAYDDEKGLTAQFDLNVLAHVNRRAHAKFDPDTFVHRAVWNAALSRVEMHLVSVKRQTVRVGDEIVRFAEGESIVTEHCYKHSSEALEQMVRRAGWTVREVFAGAERGMRLWLCEVGAVLPARLGGLDVDWEAMEEAEAAAYQPA
jgi:L-histidine N-alpha-methyltransferase